MDLNNELQSYLILQTPTATVEYKWSENASKLLIDLYKKYRNRVGTVEIRSVKMLWVIIAQELKKHNVHVTPNNCINRWRVLERNYKKFVDDQNQTGKRKYFEYKEEMDGVFTDRVNIRPEIVLHNEETDHDLVEDHGVQEASTSLIPEEASTSQMPQTTAPKLNKKSPIGRRGKGIARMRLIRENFYEEDFYGERKDCGDEEKNNVSSNRQGAKSNFKRCARIVSV
ncbi:uncharacterized protein [Diabrotica undecimpunctata]|uniref:uncharacterized protein n=1 Tax=Diabrotica undecimpunctata TaxID=50387 RepID=UPI003B640D4E